MFKSLYQNLLVQQRAEPLKVTVNRDGSFHVSAKELLKSDSASRQIKAAERLEREKKHHRGELSSSAP